MKSGKFPTWKHLFGYAAGLFICLSACNEPDLPTSEVWQAELARDWGAADPEWVSYHRPEWADDITGYQRYLRDLSPKGMTQRAERAANLLSRLPADTSGWPITDRAHWEAAQYFLQQEAGKGAISLNYDPLNPIDGWLVQLSHLLIAGHTMVISEDADFFLSRLRDVPVQARQVQTWEAARQQAGIQRHPVVKAAADSLLSQWLAYPETAHPWIRSYARKMGGMDPVEMNENRAANNLLSASILIREQINPELVKLQDLLRQGATSERPLNSSTYAILLKNKAGLETVEQGAELHALAENEWQYWDSIAQGLGPKPAYSATRKGIDDPLLVLRQTLRRERKKFLGMFEEIPESIPRLIRWEATGPGFGPTYVPPALDGSRKGTILLPPAVVNQPEGLLATYALGVPGTHLAAAGNEAAMLTWQTWPQPAWEAGWATYALQLIDRELRMMQADPALWWAYVRQKRQTALQVWLETGVYAEEWSPEAWQEAVSSANLSEEEMASLLIKIHSSPGKAAASLWGAKWLEETREIAQGDAPGLYLPPFHAKLLNLAGVPVFRVPDLWGGHKMSTLAR